MNGNRSKYIGWLTILGVLLLPGIYAAVKLFTEGHYLFNTNDVIIWCWAVSVATNFHLLNQI